MTLSDVDDGSFKTRYEVIVIGTGAGGGTLAHRLAGAGKSVLLLERGTFLPREKQNWDTVEVFKKDRYHTHEVWKDAQGHDLHPGTGYWVGGNTKVYGAALFRLREQDFETITHKGGLSPEWPVKYRDFEPYYTQAERLYEVRGQRGLDPTEPPMSADYPHPPVSHEPRIQEVADQLEKLGLHPSYVPLGVRLDERDRLSSTCIRCNTCDGFPCLVDAKADSDVMCVRPALRAGGVTLLTEAKVTRLETSASGREVTGVHVERRGERMKFRFAPAAGDPTGGTVAFAPYEGVGGISLSSNGRYEHAPHWYRQFFYADEAARGLDAVEDLAAPGMFVFDLNRGEARLVLASRAEPDAQPAIAGFASVREREDARRRQFPTPVHRAADQYVVSRPGGGKTIIAGYPWFSDWGRDTFIAVRGLCLATGAVEDASEVLLRWADVVSEGMLPNRFPDSEGAPEYNAVDASLWFVVAVYELLGHPAARLLEVDRLRLLNAIENILEGYGRGTRFGIRMDDDGLLAAGQPGVQLTWMDAKIGDWVVTPRIGKPVEVQALWLNALEIAVALNLPQQARYKSALTRAHTAFAGRFWNAERRFLYDVVDVDHEPGRVDPVLRPNQILAVGGLPFPVLQGARARSVVDAVEAALLTPCGLRSLAPTEAGYRARYAGGVFDRDGAYHQGTVWPWLLGPFVEAWVRVRGGTRDAVDEARVRFLPALRAHLETAGLGHVSEVLDAEAPYQPGGCPFQAWSLAELLRLEHRLNGDAGTVRQSVTAPRAQRSPGAHEETTP